jgi:hypothetical protein
MDEDKKFWFNLKTKQVEYGLKSNSLDRVGPFESEKEAKNAEQLLKERSERWRLEEERED